MLLVEAQAKELDPDRECYRFADDVQIMIDQEVYEDTGEIVINEQTIRRNPHFLTWRRHIRKSNILFMDGHVQRICTFS